MVLLVSFRSKVLTPHWCYWFRSIPCFPTPQWSYWFRSVPRFLTPQWSYWFHSVPRFLTPQWSYWFRSVPRFSTSHWYCWFRYYFGSIPVRAAIQHACKAGWASSVGPAVH